MADRRRILERKSIIEQQPITKWISVIETDGQSKQKKKHLVRFKQTRDVDSLKTDLTNRLQPTLGPVRHIFTPAGGTKVTNLEQLEAEREYVLGAGPQNFKKVSDILKHLEPSPKSKKKNSVSSNYSNYSDSSQVSRMTLMERQDMIAQKAREEKEKRASNNSLNRYKPDPPPVPLSPLEKRFQKKFANARKGRAERAAQERGLEILDEEETTAVVSRKNSDDHVEILDNAGENDVPVNRKPLYPGGGGENPFKQKRSSSVPAKKPNNNKIKKTKPKPKPVTDSAKTTITIKGNFVRASRLEEKFQSPSRKSSVHSTTRSEGDNDSRSPSPISRTRSASPGSDRSRSASPGSDRYRSASPGSARSNRYSRSPSPSRISRDSRSRSRTPSSTRTRSPSYAESRSRSASPGSYDRTANYSSRRSLGSKGSSPSRTASSSGDSPGGSRPLSKTYDNNMTFTRSSYDQDQSPDRSLGQSIRSSARRRSIQSGNAYDHSHRSLRYGNNYSRDSTAGTRSIARTIKSVGNGVENNNENEATLRRLKSRSSVFSYKSTTSMSPDRRPTSKPIEVDYDTDDSGLYRARGENQVTKNAKVILDSTVTKTDTPLDLQATQQIDEEDLRNQVQKFDFYD